VPQPTLSVAARAASTPRFVNRPGSVKSTCVAKGTRVAKNTAARTPVAITTAASTPGAINPHGAHIAVRAHGTVRAAVRAAIVATGTAAAALVAALPAVPPTPLAVSPTSLSATSAGAGTTTPTAAVGFHRPAAADAAPTVPTVTASVVPVAAHTALVAGRSVAMHNALGKLGARYRWGATGPNAFDCSGLVYWSYRLQGITLPRTSAAMSRIGTPVAKGDLQPGDLVFFYRPVSHVAIYVGNGHVVHASTAGSPVKISALNSMPFATARRI
jgi:cell wall-associated NlpC family hydrolase